MQKFSSHNQGIKLKNPNGRNRRGKFYGIIFNFVFKCKNKMSDKKIYFKITGIGLSPACIVEPDYLIVRLDEVDDIIKSDLDCYDPYKDKLPTYSLEPIYLTEEEFNALPEFNG